MKRTSSRTLILLVELLVTVVVYQFLAWTPSVGAATVWLGSDPNNAVDPNEASEPLPESIGSIAGIVFDDPNEVVDPNASEGGEPQPEAAVGALGVRNL
jgi:hypothetical protein